MDCPNEHSYHVWFQSAQRFQRRRLECKNLQTTMMMTDTKVTTTPYMIFWVRWPKKKNWKLHFYFLLCIHNSLYKTTYDLYHSEICVNQTLNKPESCINWTLNKVQMWEFFVHFTGINQIQVYSKHIRWFQEGSV
jgi:hypothetical protein